jgi:hypothetical protein
MLSKAKKIFVGYYNDEIDHNGEIRCKWLVTDNENEVREVDVNYKLASIEELHDWACVGDVYRGKIHTSEGIAEWYEKCHVDELGLEDCIMEYRLVS